MQGLCEVWNLLHKMRHKLIKQQANMRKMDLYAFDAHPFPIVCFHRLWRVIIEFLLIQQDYTVTKFMFTKCYIL